MMKLIIKTENASFLKGVLDKSVQLVLSFTTSALVISYIYIDY